MTKLTLNVDEKVVRRAKRFAAARNTSVSALVERLLEGVLTLPQDEMDTPVLDRLRGSLRGSQDDTDTYRRRLVEKHR